MFIVQEYFTTRECTRGLDMDGAAPTRVVVVVHVRLDVGSFGVLVEEAVASVALISNKHCGAGGDFPEGDNGKGGMELASQVEGREAALLGNVLNAL